jgi:hypothetical protein
LKLSAIFSLLLIFSLSLPAQAVMVFDTNSSVRALGMGNAYTVLAEDSSCLFYNPAGLARASGINLKIFGLHAGGQSLDKYENLQDIQDSTKFAQTLAKLYGTQAWVNAGGETAFYMPMFAAMAYDHLDATLGFENPVYPTINTRVVNDLGYTVGFGIPVGPFFEIGTTLRYVKRSGAEFDFGPSMVANLNTDAIESSITNWGRGYGADLGANIILPAPFFKAIVGAAWKNVGETHYRSEGTTPIPIDKNDVNLGVGFMINLPLISITPSIEVKHITNEDLQIARKINMGVEIGLPLLDIRGGFSEGYYTAGVGVNLGLFRIDAATYGVEMGDYPGQQEDRRYVAEFTMELGLGNFNVSPNSKGAAENSASSGKGSSGSSKSPWGGRTLKQRR